MAKDLAGKILSVAKMLPLANLSKITNAIEQTQKILSGKTIRSVDDIAGLCKGFGIGKWQFEKIKNIGNNPIAAMALAGFGYDKSDILKKLDAIESKVCNADDGLTAGSAADDDLLKYKGIKF